MRYILILMLLAFTIGKAEAQTTYKTVSSLNEAKQIVNSKDKVLQFILPLYEGCLATEVTSFVVVGKTVIITLKWTVIVARDEHNTYVNNGTSTWKGTIENGVISEGKWNSQMNVFFTAIKGGGEFILDFSSSSGYSNKTNGSNSFVQMKPFKIIVVKKGEEKKYQCDCF